MRLFAKIFATLLCVALAFASCSNDNTESTIDPSPSLDGEYFDLKVDKITTSSAEVRIEPINSFMTYSALVIDCEYFDLFSSDEEFIADELAYYQQQADARQISLEDYLSTTLYQNDQHFPVSGLSPDTDYYLYAYGLSTSGEATTPIEKVRFTTRSVEQVKASFDITLSNISPSSVSVHIDVKPASTTYYFDFLSEADYREWGGDSGAVAAYMSDMAKYYRAEGYSGEELFSSLASKGANDDDFTGLKPKSTYYAFAVGVNEQFQVNSKPEIVEFTTPDVVPSDMTFNVVISQVTAGAVYGEITPSNNSDKYFWDIQLKETCDYFEDDELMEVLTSRIDPSALPYYVQRGKSVIELDHLAPGEDYTICIFGYDGAPTTPLTRHDVSTQPAGDPQSLTLTFSVSDIGFDRATIAVDASVDNVPYIWRAVKLADYEALSAKHTTDATLADALLAAEYAAFEEAMKAVPAYEGFEWNEMLIANELFVLGDSGDTPRLSEGTEYITWGVAVDLTTGLRSSEGVFVSEPFSTTRLVAGEAAVTLSLGHYYDGTELYEKGGEEFADLKGLVLLTYTITPNNSAATWYSCIYQDDLSSATDKMIINNLVYRGYDTYTEDTPEEYRFVEKDATSGVSVLEYNRVYSLVAIAKDADGNYGKSSILPFELKRDEVSPAEELLNAASAQRAPKRMGVKFE